MAKQPLEEQTIDKQKALDDALKAIQKSYGKGAVMRLGERPRVDVDVIPIRSSFRRWRLSPRPYH